MNRTLQALSLTLVLLCGLLGLPRANTQGTLFTYQGRLQASGALANGLYDMTFGLFNAPVAGTQTGPILTNLAILVSNGLFTARLDFGAVLDGTTLWLDIAVRTNGPGPFTDLAPRQQLTPTPYAITAENLDGNLAASQLTGTLGMNLFPCPLVLNCAIGSPVFQANQSGAGAAIEGSIMGTGGTSPGVQGVTASTAPDANAIYGLVSSTQPGSSSAAVRAENRGTNFYGIGVSASQNGSGYGVYGYTPSGLSLFGYTLNGTGVRGESFNGIGVVGYHDAGTGTVAAVEGITASTDPGANAIYGLLNSTSPGGGSAAIRGDNLGTNGFGVGVYGTHSGSGFGVFGYSNHGTGVQAETFDGIGLAGYHDATSGTAAAVQGITASTDSGANAIYGLLNSTQPGGGSAAVRGDNLGTNNAGAGVYGTHNGSGWGVYGTAPNGLGVFGLSTAGTGVSGVSITGIGLSGFHNAAFGTNAAIEGTTYSADNYANAIHGVLSSTSPGFGSAAVRGDNLGTNGLGAGVYGAAPGVGVGVSGDSTGGVGVSGSSSTGTGVSGVSGSGTAVSAYCFGGGNALTIAGGGVQVSGAGLFSHTAAFVQMCTATNQSASNRTTIDNPLCNGNQNSLLFVTHNYNPAGVAGNLQTHPFSVFYNGSINKWEIYNDDGTTMPIGTTFNVLVIRP